MVGEKKVKMPNLHFTAGFGSRIVPIGEVCADLGSEVSHAARLERQQSTVRRMSLQEVV
jgi:hypothetical protein